MTKKITPEFLTEGQFTALEVDMDNVKKYSQIFAIDTENISKRTCINVEHCLSNPEYAKTCQERKNRGPLGGLFVVREHMEAADKCSTKILNNPNIFE